MQRGMRLIILLLLVVAVARIERRYAGHVNTEFTARYYRS
jgi:hypothetical protein